MEKDFVPYEEALALKELGFDEIVLVEYNSAEIGRRYTEKKISSVRHGYQIKLTYGQAFRWFREKHGLFACYEIDFGGDIHAFHIISKSFKYNENYTVAEDTYEEAELNCLRKLIEILKER